MFVRTCYFYLILGSYKSTIIDTCFVGSHLSTNFPKGVIVFELLIKALLKITRTFFFIILYFLKISMSYKRSYKRER